MNENRTYLCEFIVAFLFGLFAFIETFSFSTPIALYRYGANRWPASIAIVMMVCAALLYLYRRFYPHFHKPESQAVEHFLWKQRISVFIIPIIFVILMPHIGFYAAVLVFLPIHAWCLGQHNIVKNLAVTIPVSAFLIILFTRYLFVPFPVGTLPVFYDFNSALVALMY